MTYARGLINKDYVLLLDEHGKETSSKEFDIKMMKESQEKFKKQRIKQLEKQLTKLKNAA